MAKKRSIIKAYKRKWRRMPREDRIFVIKFLGCALLILVLVIVLLSLLIVKLTHVHREKDRPKTTEAGYVSVCPPHTVSSLLRVLDPEHAASGGDGDSSNGDGDSSSGEGDSANGEGDSGNGNSTGQTYSDDEIGLLASLIEAEAGSASRETQIAVASVILNRVQSDKYPDSISEVIYQEGQYPPAANGALNGAGDQAWEVAQYVCQNGSQIPSSVLFQSKSAQGSGVWAVLDGEYFCYE